MAGILIYKINTLYFSFTAANDFIYDGVRRDLSSNSDADIVFSRERVDLSKIDNARVSINRTVQRLESGEKVDVKKELSSFFD